MGQRIYLFIIGLGLSLIGGFFMWLMVRSYINARKTRTWDEVPAMVLQAGVQERKIGEHVPTDYSATVLFGYEYGGRRLTSELITPRGTKWAKDREKAETQLLGIEVGEATSCWVNPDHMENAILKHDTKAAGYSIWFPSLIFIGGLGVMTGSIKKRRLS